MRLIDADEVIAKAKKEAIAMSEPFKSQFGLLVEWIAGKTSTAYDVDKVVEQLKTEKEYSDADYEAYAEELGLDVEDDWHYSGLKRAIEIVKAGGIDER